MWKWVRTTHCWSTAARISLWMTSQMGLSNSIEIPDDEMHRMIFVMTEEQDSNLGMDIMSMIRGIADKPENKVENVTVYVQTVHGKEHVQAIIREAEQVHDDALVFIYCHAGSDDFFMFERDTSVMLVHDHTNNTPIIRRTHGQFGECQWRNTIVKDIPKEIERVLRSPIIDGGVSMNLIDAVYHVN